MVHGLRWSAARGIFPDPGLEPVSPELAGGFLTTAPPGKPLKVENYCIKKKVRIDHGSMKAS